MANYYVQEQCMGLKGEMKKGELELRMSMFESINGGISVTLVLRIDTFNSEMMTTVLEG